MVHSETVNTLLRPWVKERYLALYVLDCFQSSSEDFNRHTIAVVAAADILGFKDGKSRLVHHILPN
jgi:hypothetical protein